ncbi:protein kinase domain-containing protein [Agarivorans sp. MS3-6]|uniref:bifunctional protein-serine/threonine kinase/phosphatase n=1 Tax=Agarivorans sp. TSD2052 TaxID=2937286 RepID=UPI00200BF063|nr:bifunctional protein-serine/threonine kinase/phosphatase [Agarivorans sp. TSD2052]UPW19068.1 bifunctional protein-serine/threonine kinase/phosphatase [Agarivorans sp. TSD2052]
MQQEQQTAGVLPASSNRVSNSEKANATVASNKLEASFGGASISGPKPENQDACVAKIPEPWTRYYKGVVAILADGLSSAENAKVAAQISVTQFVEDYYATPESWSVNKSTAQVAKSLNNWLFQQGKQTGSYACTLSTLIIKSRVAHLFHVGDSRIYRLRGGQLRQLTRDHVQIRGKQKNHLTRALGVDSNLELDYSTHAVETGDLFMLTSDGVHDALSEQQLIQLLQLEFKGLEEHANAIVNAAELAGSDDNISAMLVSVDNVPSAELDESRAQLLHLPIPPVMTIGNKIDQYRISEILHTSPRSHVYLVEELNQQGDNSGTVRILKAPDRSMTDDNEYFAGFAREEWVGRVVSNPHIMRTFEPAGTRRFRYLIAEYVPGITLRQWMDQHPHPPIQQVVRMLEKLAKALRALRRYEMVHRDLKPENIIVTANEQLKLVDFGTVQSAEQLEQNEKNTSPVGSVQYIAPEYLVGETGKHRSDIFSFAVIAYEMLSGKLPYKPARREQVAQRHYADWHYQNIQHYRNDMPDWLDAALEQGCKPKPHQRYQSLSEFIHDLQHANPTLRASYTAKPLIERNPVRFWQSTTLILLVVVIWQWASQLS